MEQIPKLDGLRGENLTERIGGIRHDLAGHLFVPLLQLPEAGEHDLLVGCRGRRREVEQPVGDPGQRRHDYDRTAVCVRGRNVPHQPADRFRVAD
jgi:hypothetical protein